jgi:hypothetical protein
MTDDIKTAVATIAAEQEALRSESEALRKENARLRVENEILLEGCALIREAGVLIAPVIGFSNKLCETIFKVMRSPEEMRKEVDRRILDPRRTWWTETDKPKFPERGGSGT